MARIGLCIYPNDGGDVIERRLTERLCRMGHAVTGQIDMRAAYLWNGRVFTEGNRDLSALDAFYHMDADRQSPNQFDQLFALERSGVAVTNRPAAYAMARDKPTANQVLRKAGFTVPKSALMTSAELQRQAGRMIREWGAVVVKPRARHGGYGIMRFAEEGSLADFAQLGTEAGNFYCEEFIPFGDSDIRVEVAAGIGIGGYSRRRRHAFKTNICSGGIMTPNPPDAALIELAEAAARVIGLDYTILDLLKDERSGAITIIEINPLLGIFVEEAMRVSPKTDMREVDPSYALDQRKEELICAHLDRLAREHVPERVAA
jgi:ribosomal protein S6--L-glutamate ligase